MAPDHTRAEALHWALNHAEEAEVWEAHLQGLASYSPQYAEALRHLDREAVLAAMWAQVAQAMPLE